MTSLTLTAEQMFRKAYENRYTWDSNFSGYSADATMKVGDVTHKGKAIVNSDLSYEVEGVEDKDASNAIKNQLWEMTIHRVNRGFEKSHGDNTFSFGETDEDGAVEILVGGEGAGNGYKIKDDCVTFVNRKIGNKRVNINTYDFQPTEKGYLATKYDSCYVDLETNEPVTGKTVFEDNFEKVGDYYVLTTRKISSEHDGNLQTTEFVFSNFKTIEN